MDLRAVANWQRLYLVCSFDFPESITHTLEQQIIYEVKITSLQVSRISFLAGHSSSRARSRSILNKVNSEESCNLGVCGVCQDRTNKNVIARPVSFVPLLPPVNDTGIRTTLTSASMVQLHPGEHSRKNSGWRNMGTVSSSARSQRGNYTKSKAGGNCPRRDRRFYAAFHCAGKAPAREEVQIQLLQTRFRADQTLVLMVKAIFRGVQLIPQGEFSQVPHLFTFNLLHGAI